MAEDIITQATVATVPTATKFIFDETTSRGFKQVVNVSRITRPSANFTRPADTTAYASGDLVANSTTAGSVVALSWTCLPVAMNVAADGFFFIRRAKLKKSTTGVTNAAFRLHLYGTDPAVSSGIANGDNGAWSINDATYLGYFDFGALVAHRDCAQLVAAPSVGAEISHSPASGSTVYGILEARGAYTPGNAEVFTVHLEIYQP